MYKFLLLIVVLPLSFIIHAQDRYHFEDVINLDATPVISQGRTGTCWSFATTSFIESEIIRLTGKHINISEMYNVRNTYPIKAENYVMRQGKAQFDEGGLAHDVLNTIRKNGIVPYVDYTGLAEGKTVHNHAEMVAVLKSMLNTYIKNPGKTLSNKWKSSFEAILDIYLGKNVTSFTYEGAEYTPKTFQAFCKINPDNYISLTSFEQAPFYSQFILNIPDNFSNGSFYNLPLNELMATIDHALENGFTVDLDCDVSEPTFSSVDGVAVIPENPENNKNALERIYPEKTISQDYRQQQFENYNTTDDHLMHITGTVKDQQGHKYYKVKNSWGNNPYRNANGGYVYFSEAYMRLKTISITIHKDAIPKEINNKLKL